jgi:hypothetical protein
MPKETNFKQWWGKLEEDLAATRKYYKEVLGIDWDEWCKQERERFDRECAAEARKREDHQ